MFYTDSYHLWKENNKHFMMAVCWLHSTQRVGRHCGNSKCQVTILKRPFMNIDGGFNFSLLMWCPKYFWGYLSHILVV